MSDERFENSGASTNSAPYLSDEWFETTGAQAEAHDVFTQLPKTAFWLNALILSELSQSDDFRTRSERNGEYGANRE